MASRSATRKWVRRSAAAARSAAALAEALPRFLGADGERRYFFGASTPSELRGTGGYIGDYSVLTVRDGKIARFEASTIPRRPSVPSVPTSRPRPARRRRCATERH
jgi:hypothetical protein